MCCKKSSSQVSFSLLRSESRTTAFLLFPLPHFLPSVCLHLSHICTHLALICHSSQEEEKRRRKRFPHTPYKKKKIKEEENPIFFLTSEYWGARDIFQRISAKAKGLLAKSWSSRTSRTSRTGQTGRTGPISPTKKLTHSHPAAYCSRGCSGASACRKARCSRVSRQ